MKKLRIIFSHKAVKFFLLFSLCSLFGFLVIKQFYQYQHRITHIHQLAKNYLMIDEFLVDLSRLHLKLGAPGNDIFVTKNVVQEKKNLHLHHQEINHRLLKLEATLRQFNQGDHQVHDFYDNYDLNLKSSNTFFLQEILLFKQNAQKVIVYTNKILNLFQQGKIDVAAEKMAQMDQITFQGVDQLDLMTKKLDMLRNNLSVTEELASENILKDVLYFGLLLFVIVVGLFLYYLILSKKFLALKNKEESLLMEAKDLNIQLQEFQKAVEESLIFSVTNPQGKIIHANQSFCELSGYDKSELLGQDHRLLNSGTHPPEFFRELWEHVQQNKIWRGEVCNRKKNGELYWVYNTVKGIYNSKNELQKIISIRIDLTTQKKVAAELQYSISLFKSVLDGSELCMIAFDPNGKVMMFNKKSEELLGYKAQEMMGKEKALMFHCPEDIKKRSIILSQELGVEVPENYEVLIAKLKVGFIKDVQEWSYVKKDGTRFPVKVTLTKIRTPQKELIGYLIIAEDLTEHKILEENLAKQQEKLMSTAKMSTLGEMAGGIAHEINNPLAIISGKAAILRKKVSRGLIESEKFMAELELIGKTSERISKIIHGLKAFSRNADQDPYEYYSLGQIFEDTFELCHEKLKKYDISFKFDINPEQISIECRPAQLSQVFMNMISNSIDAINDHQLEEKWIHVKATLRDEKWVQIIFQDSGLGIPPEHVAKIMTPFFTTKPTGKGTGLGLSISKGIIEDHLGSLQYLASEKNTTFSIEMPLKHYEVPGSGSGENEGEGNDSGSSTGELSEDFFKKLAI